MANGFGTFDLGQIIAQAEAIKGLRRQSVLDDLQRRYLEGQISRGESAEQRAQAEEQRRAALFMQEQQIANTRLLNAAAAEVAQNPAAVSRWLPQLKSAGIIDPNFDPASMPPEQLQARAQELFESTSEALRALRSAELAPTDAPASVREWQFFNQLSPEQQDRYLEMKRSLQIATVNQVPTVIRGRGLQPLSSLPQEAAAAATVAGAEAQAREGAKADVEMSTEQQKKRIALEQTWELYKSARDGLLAGLRGTTTGPIVGRLPAVTTEQQIAEGGVAAMAPVLKQLFRAAGEGTFTDRDQELLLQMVPKRTDTPEAREAKIRNIDNIVRAKLGILDETGGQPSAGQSADFIYVPGQGLQRAGR